MREQVCKARRASQCPTTKENGGNGVCDFVSDPERPILDVVEEENKAQKQSIS